MTRSGPQGRPFPPRNHGGKAALVSGAVLVFAINAFVAFGAFSRQSGQRRNLYKFQIISENEARV